MESLVRVCNDLLTAVSGIAQPSFAPLLSILDRGRGTLIGGVGMGERQDAKCWIRTMTCTSKLLYLFRPFAKVDSWIEHAKSFGVYGIPFSQGPCILRLQSLSCNLSACSAGLGKHVLVWYMDAQGLLGPESLQVPTD